jgi:hypothetical protein
MKKFNGKFLGLQIGIILAISIIAGLCMGIGSVNPVGNTIGLSIFVALMLSMFYFMGISQTITDKLAMRTERKYSAERGFSNSETFYSSAEIFKVNEENGKIAYIANQNPLEFQEFSAADLTDVKSGYTPGTLGGTRYVYFEFMYQNKKRRIATFASNQTYSLKSEEVMEALSKADYFCEVINRAKQNVQGA